jgi:hypothetical protein
MIQYPEVDHGILLQQCICFRALEACIVCHVLSYCVYVFVTAALCQGCYMITSSPVWEAAAAVCGLLLSQVRVCPLWSIDWPGANTFLDAQKKSSRPCMRLPVPSSPIWPFEITVESTGQTYLCFVRHYHAHQSSVKEKPCP